MAMTCPGKHLRPNASINYFRGTKDLILAPRSILFAIYHVKVIGEVDSGRDERKRAARN